jgi:heme exporter protein A|tara:strand:+ start:664 stop:1275 length:612 start_codon:yes stop_codon:yes gene_type:complete
MLQVSNLSVARGGKLLLHDVSFSVQPGQALVLRGANGVGKTSLLRCIAGLQTPTSGIILAPETVAYAAHADGLKGQLSVLENLKFWADIYGGPRPDVALNSYSLGNLAYQPAANLSAGQQRRLGLARMLVTGCRLWVLDEPTVSLDVQNVALFRKVLKAHLQGGGAAVLATHIDFELLVESLDLTNYIASVDMSSSAFEEALE